jgi:hypothetical protein
MKSWSPLGFWLMVVSASLPVACGGGSPAAPTGPITAPGGEWTWIPFPDALCGDGSTTGIGVNLGAAGSRPLIYLEGGGACWSEETCYTLMTASNFTAGYGAAQFASDAASMTGLAQPGGFFDRQAASNPFQDYSYVYVPYCTGDVHAGTNVVKYDNSHTAHFVGYRNFAGYLQRLVPTFAGVDRVILAGSSAGGYGALFNWGQTQQAFGSIRVDMIDDSGTLMPPDVVAEGNGDEAAEVTAWNLSAVFPAGCATCAQDLSASYGYDAQAYPDHRAALLSYAADSVIPAFYGITTAEFTTGLDEMIAAQIAPTSNFRSFLAGSSGHVLLFDPTLTSASVTVQQFVTQMVSDDPTWASVQP